MFQQIRYYAHDFMQEWLSKLFTLQTVVVVMIILKIAKYFYYGSEHMQNYWHEHKTTSYQILTWVWEKEISGLVMILPLAILGDVILKRVFPEEFVWKKKKPNPETN